MHKYKNCSVILIFGQNHLWPTLCRLCIAVRLLYSVQTWNDNSEYSLPHLNIVATPKTFQCVHRRCPWCLDHFQNTEHLSLSVVLKLQYAEYQLNCSRISCSWIYFLRLLFPVGLILFCFSSSHSSYLSYAISLLISLYASSLKVVQVPCVEFERFLARTRKTDRRQKERVCKDRKLSGERLREKCGGKSLAGTYQRRFLAQSRISPSVFSVGFILLNSTVYFAPRTRFSCIGQVKFLTSLLWHLQWHPWALLPGCVDYTQRTVVPLLLTVPETGTPLSILMIVYMYVHLQYKVHIIHSGHKRKPMSPFTVTYSRWWQSLGQRAKSSGRWRTL